MAYLRHSETCNWYVYWEASSATSRDEEHLSVWHVAHQHLQPSFSYREVLEMLTTNDFTRVPGFSEGEAGVLRRALQEFVDDVDAEYGPRKDE